MTVTVTHGLVEGFECVVLENPRIRAVVIPPLGGRIWELVDRARNRQWVWHRDDVPLARASPGSMYDDVWAGGWEELFPNDAPGEFEGRLLHDHGGWWTAGWRVVDMTAGTVGIVRLESDTLIRGASCAKELRMAGGGDELEVSYRIASRDAEAFHFLFKQHLPIAIGPHCRLVVPGGTVTAVDPGFGSLLPGPGPFEWPSAGGVDLTVVLDASSAAREFIYVADLPDGWCGIDDASARAALRMRFDLRRLPFLWLFLAYGGWRGCYTAVLEPCTNMPKDLAEAVRQGRSARLAAGGVFETSVTVQLRGL